MNLRGIEHVRNFLSCLLNLSLLGNLIYSQRESKLCGSGASVPIWEACSYLALPMAVWSMRKSLWPHNKGCPPNPVFMNCKGDILTSICVTIVPVSQMVTKLAKRKKILFISPLNPQLKYYFELWHNFNLEEKVYIPITNMPGPSTTFIKKNTGRGFLSLR